MSSKGSITFILLRNLLNFIEPFKPIEHCIKNQAPATHTSPASL